MTRYIPTPPRGEQHHRARLTAEKVRQMRQLNWEQGLCIRCISRLYNISYASAWEAINCHTWRHV